ncbi:carboxymuconolactone decarboxylase family protein [Mycobacterium heidelbergense]|uniref:carboxymuconolactone decarboxylase family protein n=1 Tax=Mycobacterium heidelbergense TaxID=53376 RepID=UPI003CEA5E62
MSRIPTHTVDDAPQASRGLLENVIQFSPTGRPLNLHGQMAHSPAVLVAYTSLRAATAEHGTLGPQLSAALMLATGSAVGNDYVVGITGRLAKLAGWTDEQVGALRAGTATGDAKVDAIVALVREATVNSGKVSDTAWASAVESGWNAEQLTEAFAYLGLTVFTAYFLNYAQTDLDVPAGA